mgnify:CR=1 FL=1
MIQLSIQLYPADLLIGRRYNTDVSEFVRSVDDDFDWLLVGRFFVVVIVAGLLV